MTTIHQPPDGGTLHTRLVARIPGEHATLELRVVADRGSGGEPYVEVHRWACSSGEIWRPCDDRIVVRGAQLPELIEALDRARSLITDGSGR